MIDLILSTYGHLTFACGTLFLHQFAVNLFLLRQGVLDDRTLRFHLGLCLASSFYSFVSFSMVQHPSPENGLFILMLGWMAGSLCIFFYIFSMKSFLQDTSPRLMLLGKLPLLSAVGALAGLTLWKMGLVNILVDPETPQVSVQNVFMALVGGHNPHSFIKILSILILIPSIYSLFYFLYSMKRTGKFDPFLALGIAVSFAVIINDVTLSLLDRTYTPPLMFLSNVLETLRITFANQREAGERVASMEQEIVKSRRFSDAGIYYSTLAHEISNPLHAARGYLDLLSKKLDEAPSPKLEHYLGLIDRQHERALKLISGVKRFTRTGSTQIVSTSLYSLLKDSRETLDLKLYYSGVSLEISDTNTDRMIRCRPDQIVQVFTNLINNSLEAILDSSAPWIKIDWEDLDAEFVRIKFTDSGSGIPSEVRERIWSRGFSTKEEIGNGIGLSICRSIIFDHGGSIQLNPTSSNTQFLVDLPLG